MEMKKRNTNSLNETLKKREAAERERLMNEVQDGEENVPRPPRYEALFPQ